MKTKIVMNEANIDWVALLADGEERQLFEIFKQNKIQMFSHTALNNASNRFTFSDYLASELDELNLNIVLKCNGDVEKRKYSLLRTSQGWGMIREMKGVFQPIEFVINEAQTAIDNHIVIDYVGSGLGDSTDITIYAQSKLNS